MDRIAAVVGAGLVGRAWATVFARAGWEVRIFDSAATQAGAAHAWIAASLAEQQDIGLLEDAAHAASLVSVAPTLQDAVSGARWVQENLPEDVAVKRDAFEAIDAVAMPEAIVASSTSALPASTFTAGLPGRSRCLVAHPVNPPHLIPVVELCGAPWTSHEVIDRALTVMTEVGQVPIVVRREIDGFILNRLQGALLNEAMRLVGEGYVSAQDVDKTIAHGLGLRWSFMGPLATIELNAPGGVADYCARYADIYRKLASNPPAAAVWDPANVARVADGMSAPAGAQERARRMRWRDRRLLALAKHKSQQPHS